GFCKPIAFSIPDGTSAIRTGSLPGRACGVVPLVMIAPNDARSAADASKPKPKVPDATSTGVRRRKPRPRSTARLTASVMKGVRHAAPIEPIRAHARAVLAAEQIAAASTWHGTTQAGAEATSHRRFEGHLNRGQR